ncbi:MAG: flagellar basal body L-ring protein FlgH [Solidesulfovibrio sp.]|uniref:flagellar basal body L-ring protein FlgH n=1 Tax=Solidesulfovibrio sp. TaxID=2910990 RepID=UPI002B1F84DF|nr:flagellar basal body L-ring protein FlgH [Solidesulfovibrio sp.]MEA4857714.1 flagellar basal body L-ring protein FlgH [Solidesulfovibrio sp.]
MKTIRMYPLIVALGALAACAPASKQAVPMPQVTPSVAKAPPPAENPGSVFSQNQPTFLFDDTRARRIGDILTVNIIDTSKSDLKAETKNDRTASNQLGVSNYFGNKEFAGNLSGQLGGPTFGMKGLVGADNMVGATTNQKFQSKGETKRESTVTASIGCRIVNILPGGVMQVEGARQTRVNNENQIIVVKGLVRPIDVSPSNTVPSTMLADCQIEYYGEGDLADRQKSGWLTRLLDNVWPF